MVLSGATIGSRLWFHEDMVNAMRGGQARAGWSGRVAPDGTLTICLDTPTQHYRWQLTGQTRDSPHRPGTLTHEATWPD